MNLTPAVKPERLDAVDCLRGLVIVLMALDHTRDFFGNFAWGGAENAAASTPALFFTRWVTHFCAPTFVLLAGLGAYLSLARGMSKRQLFLFLLTRGLWLVFLELTVVHFGWSWEWNFRRGMWQVIWAIGWSMVGLSFLIWLPGWVIGLVGCAIVAGHNAFDGLTGVKIVEQTPWLVYLLGERGWFWDLLHTAYRVFIPAKGYSYFNLYPLLPWFGVLCAGYGLGHFMTWPAKERRRVLLLLGLLLTAGFIALRYLNGYGEPKPWKVYPGGDLPMDWMRTVMSFLSCTKYPPSFLFLLMTLGPALVLLMLLEWRWPFFHRFFTVYGRVPLFFYLIHLPFIHGLAKYVAWLQDAKPMRMGLSPLKKGYELPEVYLVWALVVLALYFPCLGYGWLKKRYGGVLKYL